MFAIDRILAPTDFSPHAEAALRYASGLAGRLGATLHLLHVLPEIIPVGPDPILIPAPSPDDVREAEARALDGLRRVLDPAWGEVPAVEHAVLRGDPVAAIVDHAADRAIDLLVIATHGRTGLAHVLLGSVAERIVREAPCPVLTIRSRGV